MLLEAIYPTKTLDWSTAMSESHNQEFPVICTHCETDIPISVLEDTIITNDGAFCSMQCVEAWRDHLLATLAIAPPEFDDDESERGLKP